LKTTTGKSAAESWGCHSSETETAERQSLSSHLRSFGLAGAKLSLRLLLLHMLGTTFTQQEQKNTFIPAVEDAFSGTKQYLHESLPHELKDFSQH